MSLLTKDTVNTDNVKKCIFLSGTLSDVRCEKFPRPRALLTGVPILILNFPILLTKGMHFQRPLPNL